MDNRNNRQEIANDTLNILKQGYFISKNGEKIEIQEVQASAEKNTITYSPAATDELIKEVKPEQGNSETKINVIAETTLNAVREVINSGFTDVVYLNFASAKNPGGGFLGGSQAQEESIARATGLYPCLLQASAYYETNRNSKSCFYTDYMIYSPDVPIIKDEDGVNLNQLYTAAVITAPAVNTGVVKQQEPNRIEEVEQVMKRRIEKVLAIACQHGHQSIVLGAWGCGVFQNNPADIALYFREVIDDKYRGRFTNIIFAVYSRNEKFINAFWAEFGRG